MHASELLALFSQSNLTDFEDPCKVHDSKELSISANHHRMIASLFPQHSQRARSTLLKYGQYDFDKQFSN
jgi:hypothetical protein